MVKVSFTVKTGPNKGKLISFNSNPKRKAKKRMSAKQKANLRKAVKANGQMSAATKKKALKKLA